MEGFGWTISVPAEHVGQAVELLGDVVQNAALGEEALRDILLAALNATYRGRATG